MPEAAPLPAALLSALHAALAAAGEALPIRSYEQLKGGFTSNAVKISARRGVYLLKWSERARPDVYVNEAHSLAAIGRAGVMRVPQVLAAALPDGAAPAFMLQEFIATRKGGWPKDMNSRLGALIATLHLSARAAAGYGVVAQLEPVAGVVIGLKPDWIAVYTTWYLQPALEHAERTGLLSAELRHGLFALFARLPALLGGVARAPALIHGDLWRNNVLADTRGAPVLIDAHAAYADREYELMIAELYGGFGPSFFSAYEATWPSEPGRRERFDLYRLSYLLTRLGDSCYGSTAAEIAAVVRWYAG